MMCEKAGEVTAKTRSKFLQLGAIFRTYSKVLYLSKQLYNPQQLCGQWINVYTNHKNLTRDGLSLASDRVARWRILLDEYAPEIIYMKGIHITVADAISRLDYDPKLNTTNEYNHATHVKSTKVLSNRNG